MVFTGGVQAEEQLGVGGLGLQEVDEGIGGVEFERGVFAGGDEVVREEGGVIGGWDATVFLEPL